MTQLVKAVASRVRDETDFDLLTTIGCADIDQGQAERAFETLYSRYVGLLKGMALGWERYGVDAGILTQTTFLRAWEKAGTFDPRKRRRNTSEGSAVKLWLLAILKHAFLDEIRKLACRQDKLPTALKESAAEYDDFLDDEDDASSTIIDAEDEADTGELLSARDSAEAQPNVKIESAKVKLVRKWLEMQTPGDRDLLLASVEYIDFQTGKCVIPPEHLSGLAAMLGVIPETIKVKRGRLLMRLKAYVLENT
jgi:DNA-directed RNA polymerase specialized sigma24 family protein